LLDGQPGLRREVTPTVIAQGAVPAGECRLRLLERDRELGRIDRAIAAAWAGSGGLLVVEGSAGAGRTTLLAAARDRGVAAGMRALGARGGELECEHAFGVVRQLFEPLLRRAPAQAHEPLADELATLARTLCGAGQPLGPDAGNSATSADAGALLALSRLALDAADVMPLLLVIDDLQYADAASLRWLAYLVRRIENARVLVVAAVRAEDPGAHAGLLAELVADAVALRPAPLGDRSVALLVGEWLGGDPDEEFCATCRAMTGGNALLLIELLAALADEHVVPARDEVARVGEIGSRAVARLVRRRLGRLSPQAQALAQALAVLGDGAAPHHVATLAGLPVPAVDVAATALGRAGLLRLDAPLSFSHPIERLAIYGDMDALPRAAAHARAAELLAGVRAPAAQVAEHLVQSPASHSPDALGILREAAQVALGRGEPATAVACLRRALGEPLESVVRADVLLELAAAEKLVDVPAAVEHLCETIALLDDDDERGVRAGLQLGRALLLGGRPRDAARALQRAIALPHCERSGLRDRLRADLLGVTLVGRRQQADASLQAAGSAGGGGVAGSMLAAMTAHHDARCGHLRDACVARAERVVSDDRLLDEEDSPAFAFASRVLVVADRFESAAGAYDRAIERARQRGASVELAFGLAFRSGLWIARGALADAERDARVALRGADAGKVRTARRLSAAFLALALLEQGELQDAGAILEEISHEPSGRSAMPLLLLVGARLRRLDGDPAGALEMLSRSAYGFAVTGQRNPALAGWRSEAALAHLALGQRHDAGRLASREVQLARAWSAPSTLGRALRVAGVCEGGDVGLDLLREAHAVVQRSPARLERAKAFVELGAAVRRRGHRVEARALLRQGLDLADACGARPLVEHARHDLRAAGARPRRHRLTGVHALTPSEHRIATMAADGLTNRQIGRALFITAKTVETHLSNTYRKLDIRARTQLPRALA
jgi:DNA-binding CsgD family transcriptional regulator